MKLISSVTYPPMAWTSLSTLEFTRGFLVGVFLLISLASCGSARNGSKSEKGKISNQELPIPPRDTLCKAIPLPLLQDSAEMRAVWLTSIYGLDWPRHTVHKASDIDLQKRELLSILDRLAEAHFNTVFLQVRHRGDLIYRSDIEPFSSALGNLMVMNQNGYDPLAFAVEECHKRGLACHAWMVALPLGNDKQVQRLAPRGVWSRHRSWTIKHHGEWYLNPALPEVHNYIAQIAQEIVSRYDVDGIHLDYIRYPEEAQSFPDKKEFAAQKIEKDRQRWRRSNISSIVQKVSESTRQVAPWVQISAATLGKYRQLAQYPRIGWTCLESVSQDPKEWIDKGWVDFIVPMMYYKNQHFDPFLEDWKKSFPSYANIIPGLGVYRLYDQSRWQTDEISSQIDMLRALNFKGFCFYREENIRPNAKGVDRMIRSKMPSPSKNIPFVRLQESPSTIPMQPIIKRVEKRGDKLRIIWEISQKQIEEVTYNLYYSIKKGERYHLLATAIEKCEYDISLSLVGDEPEIYFCVQAANRLNITGRPSMGYLYTTPRE